MSKQISYALTLLVVSSANAQQFSVTFQDGLLLPIGTVYDGTDDVELVSADLINPDRGGAPTITVDGDDGGNIAQGAIRFSNLLVSEGGAVPDQVTTGAFTITNATMRLWRISGTADDAEIAFHRVIAEDNLSEEFWTEEDSWGTLTDNIFAVGPNNSFVEWPFGPADENQFSPGGTPLQAPTGETETTADFTETNGPIFREFAGEQIKVGDSGTDQDSDNILDILEPRVLNEVPEDNDLTFVEAFEFSFFDFDVTDAVVDWLVNGDPNQGWSISNNTGDGWDFIASEAAGPLLDADPSDIGAGDVAFFDAETIIPGVAEMDEADLPDGIVFGRERNEDGSLGAVVPGTLELLAENVRPQLTVFYTGAGGPADLNFDGEVTTADYDVFLSVFGSEVDGVLPVGAIGDLDFDRDVDPGDFLEFKRLFQEATGMSLSAALAIPEPSSIVLAAFGLIAMLKRGRYQ